jgi:hypothetical protein
MRLSNLNRHALVSETIEPAGLVREVVEELRQLEPARPIDIQVGTLPACVGDASLLKQAFANLLANAFKFTRTRADARVVVGWNRSAGAYFIADNGVGFGGHVAEQLFSAFKRGHCSAQFEGTGVGLSIVRRIVERHGGRVWAESRCDEGATFLFTLELA